MTKRRCKGDGFAQKQCNAATTQSRNQTKKHAKQSAQTSDDVIFSLLPFEVVLVVAQ